MTYPRAGGHGVLRLLVLGLALAPALALAGPSAPVRQPAAAGGAAMDSGPAPHDGRSGVTSRDRGRPSAASLPPARVPHIHEIQGRAHRSPLAGTGVNRLPGVVTALTGGGFWMQGLRPDGDEATSEGVFVLTRDRPWVSVGDQVEVDGRVTESRPGESGSGDSGSGSRGLTRTEIHVSRIRVTAGGVRLPDPVVVGPGGRRAPPTVAGDRPGRDAETSGRGDTSGPGGDGLDPEKDGLDFYESLEGMRVAVDDAVVVGPRSPAGQVTVLPGNGAGASVRSARGGIVLQERDANPERMVIDDTLASIPAANVGDRFPGRNVGVLDHGHGGLTLLLTATPRITEGNLSGESTRPQRPDEIALATVDLDNLDPSDPPARFAGHAREIVHGLGAPDLIVAEKLQDNSGADDDGTVAADQTVAQLIAAISAAGGPAYDWRSIDPRNNADGGEPGGNVRVGFLFRGDRGLEFTDRPGGETATADAAAPTVAVDDGNGRPRLALSPGRVNPASPAWTDVRKPIAGEFGWRGRPLFVIANHWTASGGDDPLYGRHQPAHRLGEAQRTAQARVVADFVNSIRAIDRDARIVVAGNLNDGESSLPVRTLTRGTGLIDLPARLPPAERYTSIVAGNSRLLDHILVSPALTHRPYDFDIVHTAAEFAGRAGRQDPSIVRFAVG